MPDVPPLIRSKAEKLANSSFNLGVFSLLWGITAIPAIIQSIRALIYIRKEGASKAASRKAIFGLVFPSCILGFIVFFGLLALSFAQGNADRINCINNLKQIGLAVRLHEDDSKDMFSSVRWCDVLLAYKVDLPGNTLGVAKLLHCPAAPGNQKCSYALNRQLLGIRDTDTVAPDTVLLFESDSGWDAVGGPEIAAARHHGGLHIVRADGSVEEVQFKDLNSLRWNPFTNTPAK